VIAATVSSQAKRVFLTDFTRDLRKVGLPANLRASGRNLTFKCPVEELRQLSSVILHQARIRRLQESWRFVDSLQRRGIASQFAAGISLDTEAIRPDLQICETKEDREIFEFCRLTQSVPSAHLLYRQLPFLIRDIAHPQRALMGILGLSSSVYSMGARDQFLGWTVGNGSRRRVGLNSLLQLTVCMAVPPYSFLRAGRLIASLVLTDKVAEHFIKRYRTKRNGPNLLGIVTISAKGLHAPIFNRIKLRSGGLYQRIGCTSGYSSLLFSESTLASAKALVVRCDGSCPDNRAISTLKRALNLCDIPRESFLKSGSPKGVYLAVPDSAALKALRSGKVNYLPPYPTVDAAVSLWKEDMRKALSKREIVEKVRSFDPASCRATRERGFFDGTL